MKKNVFLFFFLIILICFFVVSNFRIFQKRREAIRKYNALEAEFIDIENQGRQARARISSQNFLEYLEKKARQELNMILPGLGWFLETVVEGPPIQDALFY